MKHDIQQGGLKQGTEMPDIAIVGIGCMFPQASDTTRFWTNIRNGADAISEVPETHWRPEDYYNQDPKAADKVYAKMGGFLEPVEFNPMDYGILPNAMDSIDTSQLLGLLAVEQALKDAGYSTERQFDRDRVSVVLGVTGTLELVIPLGARLGFPRWKEALQEAGLAAEVVEDVIGRISDSYVPWQENSFPGLLGNVVAGRISKHFDLGGTNCVVDAACGSSLSALNLAALELAAGRSDMVISGGIDTFNDIFMYTCFSKTPALSPSGHARPYAEGADGTTLGEGLGIVVLKRRTDAERDGDKIYALIKGIGASSDGRGAAIYEPDANGQKKALLRAYEQAQIKPDSIELIEGHGTGTKVGDAIEVRALSEVFGQAEQPWCALGSIKSQIGHTKAAAGAAGLIKAALALHHKTLPATIKVEQPQPSLLAPESPFYLNSTSRPWIRHTDQPRRAGVSALGFGGSNFHCLLEEYGSEKTEVDWSGDIQIIPFAAPEREALREQLAAFPASGDWQETRRQAAELRQNYDPQAAERLVLVAKKTEGKLSGQLENARKLLADPQLTGYRETPDGCYYSSQSQQGEVAMLFPGQGAQYPGMLRDLALQFPEFHATLADADRALSRAAKLAAGHLSDTIYPRPAFTEVEKTTQEEALRATEMAQPALGTVSVGAARILARFGVTAAVVGGHSYGELTALAAAEVFSTDDLFALSRLRGELMASGEGERGSMLAVSAPLARIDAFLQEHGLDLVLANRNTPEQGVLSGSSAEIERAAGLLGEAGIAAKRLDVAAAFHSELVAAAARPFAAELKRIDFLEPLKQVYSNTSAAAYPQDAAAIRDLLSKQLASPVDFVNQIENIYAAGVRTFIEVGPGARLSGMVKAILGDREVQTAAVDASNGKGDGIVDLGRVLAKLAVLGLPVQLALWDDAANDLEKPQAAAKKGISFTLTGANYFKRPDKKPPLPQASQQTIATSSPTDRGRVETESAATSPTSTAKPPAVEQTSNLQEALRLTQQNMQALQQLQEQTARLHQQFLQGQQAATESYVKLMQQQQGLMGGNEGRIPSASMEQPSKGVLSEQPSVAPSAVAETQPQPADSQPSAADSATAEVTAPALNRDRVAATLLEVIAAKTGYPQEMLELEMALDSDLGIDSIKRVEILSALQEELPELPAVRPEDLATLQTLDQIVDHLAQQAPQPAPQAQSDAPASPQLGQLNRDRVATTLLEVIAAKTGYPQEMLELEMALDSDLGIDSIKRVEILSALQEELPELPTVRPEDLATLQTLDQIVDHLAQQALQPAPQAQSGAPASPQLGQLNRDRVAATLLEVIAAKTGYPQEMLELEMALDSDLGIDSIKRVEILSALQEELPGVPAVKPEHMSTLQTVAEIVDFLATSGAPETLHEERSDTLRKPSKSLSRKILQSISLPLQRPAIDLNFAAGDEVWITDDGSALSNAVCREFTQRQLLPQKVKLADLTAGEIPDQLAGLVIVAPLSGTNDDFLKQAFLAVKALGPVLNRNAQRNGAFLTTVSRLNGYFGLEANSPVNDPLSGGLAGLLKTAALEWPLLHCKALDLAMGLEIQSTAKTLVRETLAQSPLEVGITSRGLSALELKTEALSPGRKLPVAEDELIIVSGGGRGVTAEVAVALAAATKASLLLLGRSTIAEEEPDWLTDLQSAAEIKQAIVAQAPETLRPREIEVEYQRICAEREIRTTRERILNAGGTPLYRAVDLRDSAAVAAIVKEVSQDHGPVRGVVHGAGVLADKLIVEKAEEQYQQVYSTKVDGLRTLLQVVEDQPLSFLAFFSSSTGRFGRVGQVDYAMANEVLNKIAQQQQQKRPDCRVVSLNWGPWDGGMVTPELKQLFAREGVEVIDLRVGAEYSVQELAQPPADGAVEIVVSGTDEQVEQQVEEQTNIYVSKAFDLDISVAQYPFLKSHVMDGKAVLPMAMIIEWLTHAALHNHPGLYFQGFNDLRILKGVTLEAAQTLNLQLSTGKAIKSEGRHVIPVELSSSDSSGRSLAHARAKVVLANRSAQTTQEPLQLSLPDYAYGDQSIYPSERLFHGEVFQGIRRVTGCSAEGISALTESAPPPQDWIEQPLRNSWFADPLALDSSFQLLILWSFDQYQAGSLPVFVERYRQYRDRFPAAGVEIRARIKQQGAQNARADIDFVDPVDDSLVARLENYECVIDASLNATFQRNKLTGVA